MANIVLAWELGGDYGHLARLLPLALELRRRGHNTVVIARDLFGAETLLAPHGIQWFQAPLWIGALSGLPPAEGYAELLMRFGFLNPRALTGIVRAWRNLLARLEADLIVMDHAPTALLATRGMSIGRVHLGDGFCIPPPQRPLPLFRWWQRGNAVRQADSEEKVRQVATEVLLALEAPPLGSLAELFDCDASLFLSFAELDHYADARRDPHAFVGPVFSLGQGAPAEWPQGEEARVFAYLKTGYAPLERVLGALGEARVRVLAHVPGASRATLKRFGTERMSFSESPVDIEAARRECDLAVCHGGHGTVCAMLLAGKPLLVLPMHDEQAMTAHRLVTHGVAVSLAPEGAAQAGKLVRRALADEALAAAARAFAQRHAGHDPRVAVGTAADRCEALLRAR